jgi:hypothetical protein
MKRSWSCSTSCGRASGRESSSGGVEGHASNGTGCSGSQSRCACLALDVQRNLRSQAGIKPGPLEAPSGRARDRAKCPAVARSTDRRAA